MTLKKRLSDKEWKEHRKRVITATEAPVLLGLNKWTSPNKLHQEKVNSTFNGNAYTWIGQQLEPVVVEATNKILGTNFEVIEGGGMKVFYNHPTCRLGATPDAIEGNVFLECKTTKPLNFIRYSHFPPPYYVMQVHTQLHCAGFDEGYLSIMSTDLSQTGPELYLPISIFHIKKCEKLCAMLEDEVKRYWDTVESGKMVRVNSAVKRRSHLLIQLSYKKIY